MNPLRVGIILTARFTLNALANFVDVLRLAADDGDGSRPIRCQWQIMSTDSAPVTASCGIQVSPTSKLIQPRDLDYIVVIGGLLQGGFKLDKTVMQYLCDANAAGSRFIGICTGSFVLCQLGIMKGRKCCISWFHYRHFCDEFDDIEPIAEELFVVDGDRITSSGGIGACLVAAHLVEEQFGASLAQKALHIMQIDKTRPAAMLQPAPPLLTRCNDRFVTRALLLMEQNISSPLSIAQIADRLQITSRTLQRLFQRHLGKGPLSAYLSLRLTHAQLMLASRAPIREVVRSTGFSSHSSFCAAFRRAFGRSPSDAARQTLRTAERSHSSWDMDPRVFQGGPAKC